MCCSHNMLHTVEWLCNIMLFHALMKIVTAFMFDEPKRAGTNLISLVNCIWRDSSAIPGGQQEINMGVKSIDSFLYIHWKNISSP